MLTRKKRIGIDSSPKTSVNKNIHLLSKEGIQDTVNMLSTPTRRNRFAFGNNQTNDDSPVLSQEPINISWKWNNEGTPIRSANKSSKLRRSITNNSPQLQHLRERLTKKRNSIENQNGISATSSPKSIADPETHSPKGLYKFQEEMRKIEFDTESDNSCDINKSMTADTGYPTNAEGSDPPHTNTNCRRNDSLDVQLQINGNVKPPPQNRNGSKLIVDDDLADDMFDDSDFDQILLTCQIPAEKQNTVSSENMQTNQNNVKKASSAPEIKTSCNNSNSSGSNWNLMDDDCFDDLVKDFDVDIPSDSLNTSAKFTRHKSMPQQPQTPSTSSTKAFKVQHSTHLNNNMNRKSFTRHESMPIPNTSINRATATNNNGSKQHSTLSSSQTRKCTSEEIAEKRRAALERLKNRKQNKNNT